MPRRKFSKPDELILIYYDDDDDSNNIVLRYFEGDVPDWICDTNIPMKDINLIENRTRGRRFKKILEDEAPRGGPPGGPSN